MKLALFAAALSLAAPFAHADVTPPLESDALEVGVAADGGIAFVRDKRSGRVWGKMEGPGIVRAADGEARTKPAPPVCGASLHEICYNMQHKSTPTEKGRQDIR